MNTTEHKGNKMKYDALVLEGGSLKCAFTAGVLDVFLDSDFPDFNITTAFQLAQWRCPIISLNRDNTLLKCLEN